jgi:crossover junction endodeoxyribonuclease RusA
VAHRVIVLRLPYPPSVNHLWRKGKTIAGRPVTYMSKEGTAFRGQVGWIVKGQRIKQIEWPAHVHIDAYPPDRRERDGDNLWKATLDALVHAGVLKGDSNKHVLAHSMQWHSASKVPGSTITIIPIQDSQHEHDSTLVGAIHSFWTARRA